MLVALSIQNFAIIEDVTIDFTKGMTVLSGETGAGKSIIIDALGLLIGGRGSVDYIRHGESRLAIEGQFELSSNFEVIQSTLSSFGIQLDKQDGLILRREISSNGTNVIRINGQLANVTQLKSIGPYLADIHGQHEHQALLDATQHLALLDQYGDSNYQRLLNQYHQDFETYQHIRQTWLQAQQTETDQQQRLQFLQFQFEEIDQAALNVEEEQELTQTIKKLTHVNELNHTSNQLNEVLSEGESSALSQLYQAQSLLADMVPLDESYHQFTERLTTLIYELEDLSQSIAQIDHDDLPLDSMDELQGRLATIEQLKRKYNMSVEEIIDYYEEISEEIYQLTHAEQYLTDLKNDLEKTYQKTFATAEQLSQARQSLAQSLTEDIHQELADLYLASSKFVIQFEQTKEDERLKKTQINQIQLTSNGYDLVSFYVSMNQGEEPKPLIKVASGGELSRFMLALKVIFSKDANQQVMVFDEIDTGVSGRVAHAIALKMKQVANKHQVLAITHLPQVAAIADQQLNIYKQIIDGRTTTQVKPFTLDERIEGLAQMISGTEITDASLQLARDLMSQLYDEGDEEDDS